MRPESFRTPVTLDGRHVRLVPLERSHAAALAPYWSDPRVHQYMIGLIPGPHADRVDHLIDYLLARQAHGTDLPFATLRASDARPIGMTRYLHIDRHDDAVEIGGTWLDPGQWRTAANTESKLLLLRHAFEVEGAHRVALQTDGRNLRSQTAIARLGAVREAVLREDRRLTDGRYRSSVVFAIVRSEWPTVERSLNAMLERTGSAGPAAPPGSAVPIDLAPGPTTVPPIDLHAPVTLSGRWIDLVPLERRYVPDLLRAGRDPSVWQFLRIPPGRTEAEMTALVDEFLKEHAEGLLLPFVVRSRADGVPIGMFRFLDIERGDRKTEIGTWIDSAYWRTPVNTEVKYLALRHAFETEHVHRVQLRTDARNVRSQRAIERLGAVREGEHREHLRLTDGTYRTSFVYSILEHEWPTVKEVLEAQLARPWTPNAPGSTERPDDRP